MEPNCNRLMERILRLTLEIIYLLTGEDNILVKKTSRDGQNSIVVPLYSLLISERSNDKKILEVIKKMMELLTGEVPIRCQDVTVYFSMEEWEYLEGHKDLYKDFKMASQPALALPDGSSKRNSPERCPHPMYSRDFTQEDLTISHHDQSENWSDLNIIIKNEIKREEEEDDVMEEWEDLEGHKYLYKDVMMASQPVRTSPDGSSNGNPPERCPRPLSSRDSTQEDVAIPHHHQEEEVIDMKIEVKEEEETYVRSNQMSMREAEMKLTITNEESYLDISTGEHDGWDTSDGHLILSLDSNEDDNSREQYSPGKSLITRRTQTGKGPFMCSECSKGFTQKRSLIMHQRTHTNERPFPCQDCGKCFKVKFCLDRHAELHENKASLSCSECGKSFEKRSELNVHQRSHTGKEIFSCPGCEKSFIRKYDLVVHQRSHTGEPPFSCSDCKKFFKNKRELVRHQRIHTGEKPFSCSVCGKSFAQKSQLNTHQVVHTGEKPFSCSECGKSFPSKGNRDKHMRIHTGEKPFSCPECGKCFAQKVTLIIHQRTHTTAARSPFPLLNSTNASPENRTAEKPFSCSDCGKCFDENVTLILHQKTHTTLIVNQRTHTT